jgi:hypothetical protein
MSNYLDNNYFDYGLGEVVATPRTIHGKILAQFARMAITLRHAFRNRALREKDDGFGLSNGLTDLFNSKVGNFASLFFSRPEPEIT